MKRGTEVVGVLDIEHTELQAFSTEDAEIMQSLADMLLIAINNDYANDEVLIHTGDEVACFPPVSGGGEFPDAGVTQIPCRAAEW